MFVRKSNREDPDQTAYSEANLSESVLFNRTFVADNFCSLFWNIALISAFLALLIFKHLSVADPEGVQGVRLKPPSLPLVFKYPMKMK